ncbi:hypothetical protein M438DRAFT_362167 [Aureobasidium pullulans EXF-150]|uniref:Uncharacterized protein n=1 Tax=Aureobasidium pullulans EXF-150 TaxID=1043002 RepID=A0A074XTH8_AURPU|nr:uncharacterized protein M438DRAFT_362167 [Aureobasidium pullulans EXF-150]KEQ88908.1 hypothetical protein M438DRAFT_362167 [Aureobasidium pullulans EXF-150]
MKDEQSGPGGIWRLKQSANLRHITADAQPSDSFHERMAEHAASIMKEQLPLVELALSIWRTAATPADPAPAGRRRRNARPRTEAQLQRMQQKEAYLERRREAKVGRAEENARKLRSKRHAQIAIFCGTTTSLAPSGPGQEVFIAQDFLGNHHFKRRGPGGRLKFVNREGIRYKNAFGHEEAKKQATDRFMRARAPERMEEQGWLSKAEAEMAAHHSGARAAAAGPAGPVATNEQKTARLAAEAICTAFEDAYDTEASQAALCHGANLFMAHRNSFPNGFNSAYLDLFLATYAEAMTFKPERRRNLAKTGTIEAVDHDDDEKYGQRVVTLANVGTFRRLAPVAHADALPDVHDPQLRSEFGEVWGVLRFATNTPRGLLSETEIQTGIAQQRAFSIPSDFSNWDTCCIPRVGVRVKDDELADWAILKLRRTQRLLNDHMDDVVVFFVWKEICRAAVSQDYGKMEVLLVDAKSVKYGTQ